MESQECDLWVGTKSVLHSTGLQTTRFHAAPYRAVNGNFRKFGAIFFHGVVYAPIQCLYQKEVTEMDSQECDLWVGTKSVLHSADLQTTRFHVPPYRAVKGNFRKIGATFRHGTAQGS